ncbi:transglutaminase-like cysteine peptidase [Pseudomonas sp. sp1636]|uniref:transglutaminase-like cysteine peptidase n=1 Tax=Pseudomonas sp. sp1636 TaxID=3036707 RepID=UPI0025A555D5|nr:transglutaminase-like cysteine peptidase [Pseudomonas sp. sp1636]MDM8349473.1 transglutaminase-like cysteine peptidase [Pseudomonas sp. sp1636]
MIGLHFLIAILLWRRRQVLTGLIISASLILGTAKASPLPPSVHRGEQAAQRLQDWQSLIAQSLHLSDAEKLQVVNAFFNRHIRYGEDTEVWGQVDYWASPRETLELGAGDCEDFALAKYFTLRLLGIPEQHLRLVYSTLTSTQQAHMVLGYWADEGKDPALLDNLRPEVLPTLQRPDLQMQFAFDSGHLYRFGQNRLLAVGDAQLLPGWQALKAKMRQESIPLSNAIQLVVAEQLRLKLEI